MKISSLAVRLSLLAILSESLTEEMDCLFSDVGVAPGVGKQAAVKVVGGEGDAADRMYEILLCRFVNGGPIIDDPLPEDNCRRNELEVEEAGEGERTRLSSLSIRLFLSVSMLSGVAIDEADPGDGVRDSAFNPGRGLGVSDGVGRIGELGNKDKGRRVKFAGLCRMGTGEGVVIDNSGASDPPELFARAFGVNISES